MKQLKLTILIFTVLFSTYFPSFAQDASTQGTEFWVSFMSNGHKYHPQAPNDGNWILNQLLISAKRDCNGTITNPNTGWTTSFDVQANNITTVNIPEDQAYVDATSEQVLSRGLQVVTNDTVSVFCTNIAHLSFDASYVLPIQSLADDYIIQTYDQSYAPGSQYQKVNQTSAFLIVATEDGTTIDITPAAKTLSGHQAGQTFTINMDRGQVYQVRSDNAQDNHQRDLSGSRVTSHDSKPFAVFNGNTLTSVPTSGSSFDHIFEQAMPLQSWGKKFVVTCSLEREKDYVKITSAFDNNEIRKNGELIATLGSNGSHIFPLENTEKSCFIECSGPAAVYLYNTTRGGNSIGDPSEVWIAPIEQRIDEITFSTFNNENINIDTHHVNIIVNKSDVGTVLLDGNLIPASQFEDVNGTDGYSFTRQNISHGVHHLECFGGFNAHVYGFGIAKGYAYLVGSKAIDLSTRVSMNETFVPKQGTYEYCPDATITFEAEVNLENASIVWDFGDGTTSTQNPVNHTYAEKRVYEVVLTATAKGSMSNDVSHYYVDTRKKLVTEEIEVCKGFVYTEHGLNVIITNDTILGTEIDNPVHPICKDSLLVYVTALPGYYASFNDARCWRGEPETYEGYGFNFVYDHPGVYDQQISEPTSQGCDSVIDLHLVVADRIFNPDTLVQITCSESYIWNDITYTEDGIYDQTFVSSSGCDSIVTLHLTLSNIVEGDTDTLTGSCTGLFWHGHFYDQPGYYTDTIPNSLGCDSIVHLDLSMALPPNPTPILPMDPNNTNPHWVITATEFQINSYDFHLWDTNPNCYWDTVTWSCDEAPDWILEPFGEKGKCCKVYVLEHIDDTIWLRAHAFNHCAPEEGIEQRYWLICSFYGIDDHGSSTTGTVKFDVVPNPNNGSMNLIFTNMEGKIDAKIYDMTGILIDQFALNLNAKSRHPYHLGNYPNGVYLLVFNYKGIMVTKKIVVIE